MSGGVSGKRDFWPRATVLSDQAGTGSSVELDFGRPVGQVMVYCAGGPGRALVVFDDGDTPPSSAYGVPCGEDQHTPLFGYGSRVRVWAQVGVTITAWAGHYA